MVECLCAAYPFAKVCVKDYCKENNSYECKKDQCQGTKNKMQKECECRNNPNSFECKCKLNPLLKECFCAKRKNSVYCQKEFCQNNEINDNHAFCICEKNIKADICQAQFCLKNIKNIQCKCLSNPKSFECFCDMNPNSDQCAEGKKNNSGYLNHLKNVDKNFVYPPVDKNLQNILKQGKKDVKKNDVNKTFDFFKSKNKNEDEKKFDDVKTKKIFEKLNSKFRNPSNQNFKLFYKFNEDGNIIPRKGQLQILNPSNPEFTKYYKLDIQGKIVPKMNASNPNFKLYYKNDKFGNILPREFLLKKNTENFSNEQRNEEKKTFNKTDNQIGPKGNKIKFDIDDPKTGAFYDRLYSKFKDQNNANFNKFFTIDKDGKIINKKSQMAYLDPFNPNFGNFYRINKRGRIIPNPNPNSPNFSLFFKFDNNYNAVSRNFLKNLNLNSKKFNRFYDGANNFLFRSFNRFGNQNFFFRKNQNRYDNFLPRSKIKGPGGFYYSPDGRKLGKPFGEFKNGRWYDFESNLLTPLVRYGKDGKLYCPNGNQVGPSAFIGPDERYYSPEGTYIYPLYGKLGCDGRYYGLDGKIFGPKGKLGDDGKFYEKNGKIMAKYAIYGKDGKYEGPYGNLGDDGKYRDKKGNLINNKKSIFGVLGFNPYGKNGKFKDFNYKSPEVVTFYNKMYGKFSDPKNKDFKFFFKIDDKGNTVPKETMLSMLDPYDTQFNKLFKINVKGRITPNDSPANPQLNLFYNKDKDGKITEKKVLSDMNLFSHFKNKIFDGINFNVYDYGFGNDFRSFDIKDPSVNRYFDEIYGKFKNPNNEKFNEYYKFNDKGKIEPLVDQIKKFNPLSPEFIKEFEYNKPAKAVPRPNPKSPVFSDYYTLDEKDNVQPSKALLDLEYVKKFKFNNPEMTSYYKILFGAFMSPKNKNFKKFFKYNDNGKLIPLPREIANFNPDSPLFKRLYQINAAGKIIPKNDPSNYLFKYFYNKKGKKITFKDFFKNLKLDSVKFNVMKNYKYLKLAYGRPFNVEDSSVIKHYNKLYSQQMNPSSVFFNQFFQYDKITKKISPKLSELKIINPDHEDFNDFYEYNRFGRIIPRASQSNQNFKLFYYLDKKGNIKPNDFFISLGLDYFKKAIKKFKTTFGKASNKNKNAKNGLGKNANLNKKGSFNLKDKKVIDYYNKLFGKFKKQGDSKFESFFKLNKQGNIEPRNSQMKLLNPNDFKNFNKYYEFNKKGRILPRADASNPYFKIFYKNDKNGNIVPNSYLVSLNLYDLPNFYNNGKKKQKDFNIKNLYNKFYSQYKNKKDPNFKIYFKINSSGIIVPRANKIKFLNPDHKDFKKYYDFDKFGNIIPRMSVSNPNYRLFYKFDNQGNLIPNKYLKGKLKNKNKSKKFKKYIFDKNIKKPLKDKKKGKTVSAKSKDHISDSTSKLINKKLENSGIKVTYDKDSQGNDIISLSKRKSGDCYQPQVRKLSLPLPNPKNINAISKPTNQVKIKGRIYKNKTECEADKLPLIELECDKNDIYCLCRNHPQYNECVCLAFPKSITCSKSYCNDHKDEYECNPSICDKDPTSDKCFCKNNMEDVKCKCKVNPFDKECFCLNYPVSHLCNENACKINPNSLFCSCRANLRNKKCTPRYCFDNPNNIYCKCIVNPLSDDCKCLNDPTFCDSILNI